MSRHFPRDIWQLLTQCPRGRSIIQCLRISFTICLCLRITCDVKWWIWSGNCNKEEHFCSNWVPEEKANSVDLDNTCTTPVSLGSSALQGSTHALHGSLNIFHLNDTHSHPAIMQPWKLSMHKRRTDCQILGRKAFFEGMLWVSHGCVHTCPALVSLLLDAVPREMLFQGVGTVSANGGHCDFVAAPSLLISSCSGWVAWPPLHHICLLSGAFTAWRKSLFADDNAIN